MAITITGVKGTNVAGSPPAPATIQVEGTADVCEEVIVESSCLREGMVVSDDLPQSGGAWSVSFANELGCKCGDLIQVQAYCRPGFGSDAGTGWQTFTIDCGTCPTITPSVQVGACNPDSTRQPTDLVLAFNPPLPSGATYDVYFVPVVQPSIRVQGTVLPGMTLPALSSQITQAITAGVPIYPTAFGTITLPGGQQCPLGIVEFSTIPGGKSVVVDACNEPICRSVTLTKQLLGTCATEAVPLAIDFTATVNRVPPAYGGSYRWQIQQRDDQGIYQIQQSTAIPAPFGAVLQRSFAPGDYIVSVIINNPTVDAAGNPCDPIASDEDQFTVLHCHCPIFTGELDAVQSDPSKSCTWDFNALVRNPANAGPLEFVWDFGDPGSQGNTLTRQVPSASHEFSRDGHFTVTVTLRVPTRPECGERLRSTVVAVDCHKPNGNGGRDFSGDLTTVPVPHPTPKPSGWPDICSILLWVWVGAYVTTALLLYFHQKGASVYSASAYLGALATWAAICCFDCAKRFWRCCTLLLWHVLATAMAVTAMAGAGRLGALSVPIPNLPGDPAVLQTYILAGGAFAAALVPARCTGQIPNLFNPKTWPPTEC